MHAFERETDKFFKRHMKVVWNRVMAKSSTEMLNQSIGTLINRVIASEAITVVAHNHSISSGSVTNLSTINGPSFEGYTVVLRRAPLSSNITVVDSATINLAGGVNFLMDTDDDQLWLVRKGTAWNELSRYEAL